MADERAASPPHLRVARQSGRLDAVVAFYRDGLGFDEIGRFTGHRGYDGVMLRPAGADWHLEFTATEHLAPPAPHRESLLVLYLGDQAAVDAALARLGATPVAAANPYWNDCATTVADPDGFHVVLVPESWRA